MRVVSSSSFLGRWLKTDHGNWKTVLKAVVLACAFIFAITSGYFFNSQIVLAQDPPPSTGFPTSLDEANQRFKDNANNNSLSAGADTAFAYFLTILGTIFHNITVGIAKFMLLMMDWILVPILQYNGFATSNTTDLGWSLVRNVVNLFVVLILIVMAAASVLGVKKYNWEQNLPQFLLAVVLVNFSRTICSLMIDASQVVMFTFVNALTDVAAGNFADLLNITEFGAYSLPVDDDTSRSITAADQLAAAYLQFILYAVICAVLVLLALVFLYRIVVLWVLVIMSPLAFFLGGLKGMFSFAGGATEWWSKFTAALTIGPMLTFFLWLAIAAGSSPEGFGTNDGFEGSDVDSGLILETFGNSKLMSVVIALIFLVIGMQQSASAAKNLGGFAGSLINEKMGQRLVGGSIAAFGGRAVARAGAEGTRRVTAGVVRAGGNIGSQQILSGPLGSAERAVRGVIGRNIVTGAGFIQQQAEGYQKAGAKAASDRAKNWTDEQRLANQRIVGAQGVPVTASVGTLDDSRQTLLDFATNETARKNAKSNLSEEDYNRLSDRSLAYAHQQRNSLDEPQKEKLLKFKTEQAHRLNAVLGAGELATHIDSGKLNARDFSQEALADGNVLAAVNNKQVKAGVSLGDEIRQGIHGTSAREAIGLAAAAPLYDSAHAQGRPSLANTAAPPEAIVSNLVLKRIRVNSLEANDFTGPNGDALSTALLQTERSRDSITNPAARAEYVTRANALAASGALTSKQLSFHDVEEIRAGTSVTTLFTDPTTGYFDEDRAMRALQRRPEFVDHFEPEVAAGNADAIAAVARAASAEQIEKFLLRHQNSSNPAEQAHMEDAVRTMVEAVDQHVASLGLSARELRGREPELANAYNRLRRVAPQMNVRELPRLT